jgi:protein TonB
MNMQLPHDAFDVAKAHPLKKIGRSRSYLKSRALAALITVAAHIAVIAALVAGVHTVQTIHQPASIMVRIEPEKKKPEDLPPPIVPAFAKPSIITVPMPQIIMAPPPNAIAAAPVAALTPPHPPTAITSPIPSTSNAISTWRGLLMARLEQAKRYPEAARFHRQQGVVLLHFTMDRDGRVLSANIQKSSGYDSLDQETLALIQRAQPLPKPPPEITGNPIELVVPIEFYLNTHR